MACKNYCDRFKIHKPFKRAYKDGYFYCSKCNYHEKIELLDGSLRCMCCHYRVRLNKRKNDANKVVHRY